MMKLPDPLAFDVLGRPVAPTAAPVLRIIGGEASAASAGGPPRSRQSRRRRSPSIRHDTATRP